MSSKEQLVDAQREIESLNINIGDLEEKTSKSQVIANENQKHKGKLAKLYEMEMIDRNGDPK